MTIAELYSVCVGEGGMSPEYFMHSLTFWEAVLFAKGIQRRSYTSWETARYVAYYAAAPHCKGFGFEKMGKFPWEKDNETKDQEYDAEELAAFRERIRVRDEELNKVADLRQDEAISRGLGPIKT